jgi:outer membrane immunogenic protein
MKLNGNLSPVRVAAFASLAAFSMGANSASAQDRWAGGSAGIFLGGAFGTHSVSSVVSCPGAAGTCWVNTPAVLSQVGGLASASTNFSKGLVGAKLGYDARFGGALIGAVADIQTFNTSTAFASIAPAVGFPGVTVGAGAGISTKWLSTLRARVGFNPTDDLLLYATGGLALSSITVANAEADSTGGSGSSSKSQLKTGSAFGVGAEYALNKTLSISGDYMRVNFGGVSTTTSYNNGAATANLGVTSGSLSANILRMGVNTKF